MGEEERRRMAVCTACGSAYAARVASDGTVQPIGSKDGCRCGSSEFEVVEGSTDVGRREEEFD
ncbi:hypothetical protein [Natronococcus sp.]|uniref:hypothetical protein n=1 Tax=Natronococcus sp. TaxID=35747 RepID=UPI003A4D2E66